MVVHRFVCDNCGEIVHDTDTKIVHVCPICKTDMRWDLRGVGIGSGDFEHISESLAVSPSQISEHKQMFPDIDVIPDGRLRFTSVSQMDRYMKKTGYVKHPKKGR